MSLYLKESEARNASPVSTLETRMEYANVILLFGCTGTGKTSFANTASESEMEVGKGIRSSTKHIEASKVFQVDDQPVVVVDCPGFNDTYLTETEILRRLAEFLTTAYEKKYKVAGLLYVHKISDTRIGGASLRQMNMFKALCGTSAFKNVVYVTNMWSEPPTEDEILREQELRDSDEFFADPLAEGAQMVRHNNTQGSAHNIIRKLLGGEPVVTRLQRQLVDGKLPLEETGAGRVIGQDLEDNLLKQKQEMVELMVEKAKALEANDQNWLRRLETQEERTRIEEQRLVNQLQALKASKAKRSETTNHYVRTAQIKATDPKLSLLLERMEAKTNELAQSAKLHDVRREASPLGQREWDRQRDEEMARDIARIEEMTARSRRHGANPGPGLFLDMLEHVVGAFFPRRNRDPSPTATDDFHRPRVNPSMAYGPPVGNIGTGPIQGARPRERSRQGRTSSGSWTGRSDGHRSAHQGPEGHTATQRKRSQDNEASRALDPRYSSPGYE
ncbi:unnamed protein product [Rhizoctonia solani]|uniref:G domain-containing protein n=1 Tax=Rhizoctonia solani TaxID=456999 RepID=A0A8H2XCW7_9AGAM|nr:unnamed protein product [Rhizoctonia solani]